MALVKLEPKDWVTEVPRFPDIPQEEWVRRVARAKRLMAERGIDALVVWKREDVRYFFGFNTAHWEIASFQPAVGIIPVDGEPAIVVPDLLTINAEVFCWTRNIWVQQGAHELPAVRQLPLDVASLMMEMGLGNKTIAWESGRLGCMWIPRPLNDIRAFTNALSKATFVDGDEVIWGCRMIKSPMEVARIKQANEVIKKCHAAVVEEYRPGMTERDIGRLIHTVEIESGDLGGGDTGLAHHIVCNLEKEGICDILALDDVPIGKKDYIQVDLQHGHQGYWADIARIFQVGPITPEIQRGYDICREGLEIGASLVKPGARIKDIYRGAIQPVVDAGYTPFEMAGHGIGLDVHEPPSVDGFNDMECQPGMVFALEVWVFTDLRRRGGIGVYGYEDEYLVTETGFERIEGLSKDIIQVNHPIV